MRLVGLGAGGHAAVMIETLRAIGRDEVIGLVTPDESGSSVLGVPIIGRDEDLRVLKRSGIDGVFLAIGMMGNTSCRKRLVERAQEAELVVIGAVHPTAIIAATATVDLTAQIMAGAIVQARARIEPHALVNSGAIIEHDTRIESFAHVAPGARLGGSVTVGEGSFVGMAATIKHGVVIGPRAIVGAGAVAIRDVSEESTVVGVPARPLWSMVPLVG